MLTAPARAHKEGTFVISLGIYEKALPRTESWMKRLKMVRDLGFNFLELSVDESGPVGLDGSKTGEGA